jgi:hypothetical protein
MHLVEFGRALEARLDQPAGAFELGALEIGLGEEFGLVEPGIAAEQRADELGMTGEFGAAELGTTLELGLLETRGGGERGGRLAQKLTLFEIGGRGKGGVIE